MWGWRIRPGRRIGYTVKRDMPGLAGAAVEAPYRRGAAWLAGGGL